MTGAAVREFSWTSSVHRSRSFGAARGCHGVIGLPGFRSSEVAATAAILVVASGALCFGSDPTDTIVSGVVDVMDSIVPDGSPAFIGSHNQPGDEPL